MYKQNKQCSKCHVENCFVSKYTQGSYCNKCELECFPERFYPCAFCRVPVSMQIACLGCNAENIIGYESYELLRADFELWSAIHKWQNDICELTLPGQFIGTYEDTLKFSLEKENRGFYLGNNTWKKLNYIPKMTTNAIALEEPDPRFIGLTEFLQDKYKYAKKMKEFKEKENSYKNLRLRLDEYVSEMNYSDEMDRINLEVLSHMVNEIDLFGTDQFQKRYLSFLVCILLMILLNY